MSLVRLDHGPALDLFEGCICYIQASLWQRGSESPGGPGSPGLLPASSLLRCKGNNMMNGRFTPLLLTALY